MSPKDRADAIMELKDMAYEMERRCAQMDGESFSRGQRMERALMLRAVAIELELSGIVEPRP